MIEVTGTYYLNPLGYFFTSHTYEIMIPILIVLVFLFLINFKTVKKYFSKIDKKTWVILILIFLVGFWLRNSGYRYGAHVDGYFYQEAAKTIYEKNLFLKGCAIGSLENCRLYHEVLWPQGYPYLITILFHIFGEHDILAMYLSGVLGSLTIFLVFGIAYLLFKSKKIGLYSAAIFAFIPLDIYLSSTAAVRTTSLFFISLTILTFLISLKENSVKMWSLFSIVFSYTLYTRQENLVLLAPLIFLFLSYNWGKLKKIKHIKKYFEILSIPALIFIVTTIPFFHWLLFSNINYGGNVPTLSLRYIPRNLPYMMNNMFFREEFSGKFLFIPWVSGLMILSIAILVEIYVKKERVVNYIFLWIYFLVFFIGTSMYFDPSANSIRRMQPLFLPYSILAAIPIFLVAEKFKSYKKYVLPILLLSLFSSGFFFGISYKPYIFRDERMEENFTRSFVEAVNSTPINSLTFISQTTVPDFDLLKRGRRFIDIDLIPANHYKFTYEELNYSKNRPMYFIDAYRCRHEKDESCNFIYKNFKFLNCSELPNAKIYGINTKVWKIKYLSDRNQ